MPTPDVPAAATWRYPSSFWIANSIELCERAAYYGLFISLVLFLTNVAGFTDVQAGWVGAFFAALVYLLPFMTGALADRMGYRPALLLSFTLLTIGYAGVGLVPSKPGVIASLVLVATGASFVKPIIAGTVARTSDVASRARAYSLFYMVVNIGSFTGKAVAKPVRTGLGLDHVPLFAAGAAAIALVLVALFYRAPAPREDIARAEPPSLRGLVTVLKNGRFLALILITAGFWIIQGQLYASMPKYVIRMVGDQASPEWIANVNPFVVVLCVVPITQLARRLSPVASILIAMALVPCGALGMSASNLLAGTSFAGSVHPVTVMMIAGIALVGLAECFLSPRYLEYASKQAPPGQEALYLGYSNLNIFVAWLVGFISSGYLLEAFCPDPKTRTLAEQAARLAALADKTAMPEAWARAHHLWYFFVGVGGLAFVLLLAFQQVTSRRDRRR